MINNPSIYSASKIWHATKWLEARDRLGYNIIATWIDIPCGTPENPTGAKALNPAEKKLLWEACSRETTMADMTIVYAEEGDEMRGALVEMGSAMGAKKPIYIIGDCASFRACGHSDVAFMYHPLVHRLPTDDWKRGYSLAIHHYRANYESLQRHRSLAHFA